jgi:hypothetical protein
MLPGIKIIGFTILSKESSEALFADTEFDVTPCKHDGLTNLA